MSGRSSEAHVDKKYRRLIDREVYLQKNLPQLYSFIETKMDTFRGLNITLSKKSGMLVILKRFGDDGGLQIMFGGSHSPLEALFVIEEILATDGWKDDQEWVGPSGKKDK